MTFIPAVRHRGNTPVFAMKYSLILLMMVLAQPLFSQQTSVDPVLACPDSVYNLGSVDEFPQFPGGMAEFFSFIRKKFRYSPDVCTEGKIHISFIVEKDGSLSNIKISAGSLENEATGSVPKWSPATIRCIPVRVRFSIFMCIKPG